VADTIKPTLRNLAGIAVQRKLAEEALAASEQVARGQVEALAQSLDVWQLRREPGSSLGRC